MTDAPTPAPVDPAAAAAAAPPGTPAAPAAPSRPEWLPEAYWDAKDGLKGDDFGKHYAETTAAAQKWTERAAAVPEKPDGYKVELKLPDTVKVPEGVTFDPAKDPRTPQFLQVAHGLGLDNTQVNALIALDAQIALASHTAENARIAEETKKLGEKASDRIAAAKNWLTAQTGDGKTFTADEAAEIRQMTSSAAGVTALEKMMAKVNGGIPGYVPTDPPKPAPKTHAERIWPGGFNPNPQAARAS